jgi:antitoxin component YwqK of YwqJK toxin-antitoxin module
MSSYQLLYETYYVNGELHRLDGSAYQSWYENGELLYDEYYINGEELTSGEFIVMRREINLKELLT